MPLPFDARQFFEVFARYNTAVWPAQIVLQLAALSAVALAVRHRPGSDRATGVILGCLWLWMGGVYHVVFFRSINPAASLFGALFLLEGLLLLGVAGLRERLHFAWTPTKGGTVGAALLVYALVLYPMLAYALGHRYPAMPTFGLPCPTAILTLGLLAWVTPPRPWSVLAIPLLWSAVGASAAVQLGVWEDLGLVAAGGLTLAVTLTRAPRATEDVPMSRRPPSSGARMRGVRRALLIAGLFLGMAGSAQAQSSRPLFVALPLRFESWQAAAPLGRTGKPADGQFVVTSRNRKGQALLGGVIGAAAGVVSCTTVSTLTNDSAEGGLSFCPLDSYLLIGGAGFVLGAAIGWVI